tara:strand:- start:42 stop:998 length:957 start_codon:yes stop_codon:yes gene_type:complete
MSDVLWEDMIKQPPPPPPPAPPMPPPPMGGMPPPPGMGMNTPDPPGKIVQDAPGTQQETVAVDPDKEEEDDEQVEKGAIQDWQSQLQGGGTYAQTPTGIYMPSYTNPQNPQQAQQAQQGQQEEVPDSSVQPSTSTYQQNLNWNARGATGENAPNLSDMNDKNIEEYWDAMIAQGNIKQIEKPTRGSLAWVNPLVFDDAEGKQVDNRRLAQPETKESKPQGNQAQGNQKSNWFSNVVSAPSKAINRAADAVFGTDEEIQNETWMETMTQGRPERKAKKNRARELVANKRRTGKNTQSTATRNERGERLVDSEDSTWRDE